VLQELQALRLELSNERRRSESLAGRVREQQRALAAELLEAREERQGVSHLLGDCTVAATPLPPGRHLPEAAPPHLGGSAAIAQSSASEDVAAMQLAWTLHRDVCGLMAQGLEIRQLAAEREAELKAALAESEAARARAEEAASARSATPPQSGGSAAPPALSEATPRGPGATEEDGLALCEQAVREALVSRLEAQVKALEMQVRLKDCELQAAQSHAVRSDNVVRQV